MPMIKMKTDVVLSLKGSNYFQFMHFVIIWNYCMNIGSGIKC